MRCVYSDKSNDIRKRGVDVESIKNLAAPILDVAPDKIDVIQCNVGDVNSSYIAKCKDKKVFIKIAGSDDLPVLYSGQIERELTGMKLCSDNGILCPSLLASDLTGKSFPQKYLITEFMEHPLLHEVWSTLDAAGKLSIKKESLDLIRSLSKISSPFFGDVYEGGSIGRFESWSQTFLRLIQIAVSDCEGYGTLNQNETNTILQAANACSMHLPLQDMPCFCHLDMHWNNIFVHKKGDIYRIAGIIDFGSSLYAPQYSDFFRLQNGFLYGTESFYDDIDKPYVINIHQFFASDIYSNMDYLVFLSFTKQKSMAVKERIIDKCNDYLNRV